MLKHCKSLCVCVCQFYMTTIIEYNQFNDQRKLEILFEGNTYKQQQQQQQQEKCIEWDSIFFLLGQCNVCMSYSCCYGTFFILRYWQ